MAASFASDSEAAGEFVYTRIQTMLPAGLARKISPQKAETASIAGRAQSADPPGLN